MWNRLLEWWKYSWLDTYLTRIFTWIRDMLFPRQRWLTRLIPRHFSDKTHLIPTLMFAMLVDFVEKEDGLEMLAYQATSAQDTLDNFDNADHGWGDRQSLQQRLETYREIHRELTIAYRWTLAREQAFETAGDELDRHIQEHGIINPSAERLQLILDHRDREAELYAYDDECLGYIARHHRAMWT